ncbi:MAG: hypothetical protein ACAH80_11265 [Alphaproteobacteria bacterium]
MKYFILALMLLYSLPAMAEDTSGWPPLHVALLRDFSKWQVYDEAYGDLNGDGIKDAAVIMFLEPKDGEERGSAAVAVLFGIDKDGKEFKMHAQAGGATCVGCGGPKASFTDPMGKLGITDKGILTIDYSGGARSMYDLNTKWRYDKGYNRIVLIGETRVVTDTMGEYPVDKFDINYSTLKAERMIGDKKITCLIPKEWKNQELASFDYELHGEHLSDLGGENCKP